MSEYINDPDLLARLNSSDEYVSDPTLLSRLQGEESGTEMPEQVDMLGNMAQQALPTAAAKTAMTYGPAVPGAVAGEVASWGRVLPNVGASGLVDLAKQTVQNPIKMAKEMGTAYVQGHNIYGPIAQQMAGKTGPQIAGMVGRGAMGLAGQVMAAPESAFLYPYNMAAYEQAKIRANPTAPGLEYNPYAQTVRGEYPTQAAAGAANRRQAIRSQQYGGLTANEQEMLRRDQELSYAMRLKAARKVLGQE